MNPELQNNTIILEDTTNFSGLIRKNVFHWPLYLVMALLSIVLATIYLRYKKPVYSSVAKIYIKDTKEGGDFTEMQNLSLFTGGKVVDNEMEVIKSPIILEDVIRDNNFNVKYFEKGNFATNELYKNSPLKINILTDSNQVGDYFFEIIPRKDQKFDIKYGGDNLKTITTLYNQPFTVNKDRFSLSNAGGLINNTKTYLVKIDSIIPLAYAKSGEINASLVNRSGSVFQLSYEDEVPKRTADFINSVLNTYNNYTLEDKNKIAINTIKFIDTRLQSLGGELSSVERDVESFKRSRGITEIGENSRLYLEQVKDADQRLNVADIQLQVYNQIERFINNPGSEESLTPALGNVDQALVSVINRFQDLLRERTRLSLSLQPGNQILENLEQQINSTRETIRSYVANYRKSAVTTKSNLQKTVNEIEGLIANVPSYERQFISIKRQQGVKESLYSYLLQKREEAAVASASNIIDNKIISPAYIPTSPIRPHRNIVYLVFIIIGVILTTLYIFLKYSLNKRVTEKNDIKNILNIPVVAEIFEQKLSKKKADIENERSVLKEQMLNLRNNLKFILSEVKSSPVILFSSSISGEGKTFLSSHLGQSLTFNNSKVILLELDLRKPKLSKMFGISNASGITNYLIGAETLDQVIKEIPGEKGLSIIPSGPIPPNPIELLESDKMKELMQILKERFDYVIIDTSPLGLVSDAKSLSPLIDCLLFVIRFNYTPKVKLTSVAESVDSGIFKRKALIFNGITVESSYAYYSYGSTQYGYGYGGDNNKGVSIFSHLKGRFL
jgi:capsular exopolysaccharide synthesis family protein